MADPFNLDLTAAQINTTLNNAHDSGNSPEPNSGKLVNSNKIHQFVTGLVGDEVNAREAADTALDDRVADLEDVSISYAKFTKSSGSGNNNFLVSGYTEADPDGIASESSGTITVTGSGLFLVSFSIVYGASSAGSNVSFRSDGSILTSRNEASLTGVDTHMSYSTPILSTGSFTLDMRIVSGNSNVEYTYAEINALKLT